MKSNKLDIDRLFLEYRRTGKQEPYNKIITYLEKKLFNRINFYIKDKDQTLDILQNIWLKVDRKKSEFNPELSNFETWLFTKIAWGFILHHFRNIKEGKEVRFSNIEREDQEEDFFEMQKEDSLSPEELFDQKERNKAILRILKKIDESYQDVFILHNIAGMPLNELSELLNTPYATIRTWHSRAKTSLINLTKRLIS